MYNIIASILYWSSGSSGLAASYTRIAIGIMISIVITHITLYQYTILRIARGRGLLYTYSLHVSIWTWSLHRGMHWYASGVNRARVEDAREVIDLSVRLSKGFLDNNNVNNARCVHIYMYIHIYIYMSMYIYIYMYIYTHMYVRLSKGPLAGCPPSRPGRVPTYVCIYWC